MIAKCLALLYVIMPVFIAQDVVISSLLLNFFSKVSMKIMSLSFNRVYDQALFIFLREFSYKDSQTHLWSLARSHRRNSSLLPKSVSLLEFWKNWSCILISKIIWCLFKNDIFDILLVEWQVNQTTPALRWLNYKPKKKEMNKHPYPMTLESCVFKCMNNGM